MPDLGNRGLKMLFVLICPRFLAEKHLNNEAKCGKILEAMFVKILDAKLMQLAWLLYELTGEIQDPKLFHKTCIRIVCVYRDFPICVPLAGSVEPAVCQHDNHSKRRDQLLPGQLTELMDVQDQDLDILFDRIAPKGAEELYIYRDNSRHMQCFFVPGWAVLWSICVF